MFLTFMATTFTNKIFSYGAVLFEVFFFPTNVTEIVGKH